MRRAEPERLARDDRVITEKLRLRLEMRECPVDHRRTDARIKDILAGKIPAGESRFWKARRIWATARWRSPLASFPLARPLAHSATYKYPPGCWRARRTTSCRPRRDRTRASRSRSAARDIASPVRSRDRAADIVHMLRRIPDAAVAIDAEREGEAGARQRVPVTRSRSGSSGRACRRRIRIITRCRRCPAGCGAETPCCSALATW